MGRPTLRLFYERGGLLDLDCFAREVALIRMQWFGDKGRRRLDFNGLIHSQRVLCYLERIGVPEVPETLDYE